jgi:hypothetical protein
MVRGDRRREPCHREHDPEPSRGVGIEQEARRERRESESDEPEVPTVNTATLRAESGLGVLL